MNVAPPRPGSSVPQRSTNVPAVRLVLATTIRIDPPIRNPAQSISRWQ